MTNYRLRDFDFMLLVGIVIVTGITLAAYVFFLYVPMVSSYENEKWLVQKTRYEILNARNDKLLNEKLKKILPEIKNTEAKLNKVFRSAEFSSSILESSQKNGFLVTSETYSSGSQEYFDWVQIELEGSYTAIRSFMNDLTDFPYMAVVEKMSMREKSTDLVIAKFTLKIFHAKERHEEKY